MRKTITLLMAVALAAATAALADSDEDENYGHEALLEASRSGEVMPLIAILSKIHPITGDHIVDIEFERDDGVFKYGIYYLDPQGLRREVYVDARTGNVLEDRVAD